MRIGIGIFALAWLVLSIIGFITNNDNKMIILSISQVWLVGLLIINELENKKY